MYGEKKFTLFKPGLGFEPLGLELGFSWLKDTFQRICIPFAEDNMKVEFPFMTQLPSSKV